MKKYLLMLATAVVALGFASCSNEEEDETPAPKSEIKLNISVSNLDGGNDVNGGVSTKAAKTGWVNGDKLNLWFGETQSSGSPEMVLVFNGTQWAIEGTLTSSQISKISSSATFSVFYESGNDLSQYNILGYDIEPNKAINGRHSHNLEVVCRGISYEFSDNTLTANITGWKFITGVQITVTDVPSEFNTSNTTLLDSYFWLSGLRSINRYNGVMSIAGATGGAGAVRGEEANSLVFYFRKGTELTDAYVRLTINNGETSKYFLKDNVTIAETGEDNFKAIKISFSSFH